MAPRESRLDTGLKFPPLKPTSAEALVEQALANESSAAKYVPPKSTPKPPVEFPETPTASMQAVSPDVQAAALEDAAASGVAFCEECAKSEQEEEEGEESEDSEASDAPTSSTAAGESEADEADATE